MTELRFHDASEAPLPPQETRIEALRIEPWPDGHRVVVALQISPFQQRPNIHVGIYDKDGREVASVSAIQTLQRHLSFTLHLRAADTRGAYTLQAHVVYPDPDLNLGMVDCVEAAFEISWAISPHG
jgi:hypothetical protein